MVDQHRQHPVFNVGLPGARMKLVGGDGGHVEHEELIDQVLLAPSERAVVDVLMERPGELALQHHVTPRIGPIGSLAFMCKMSQRDGRVLPSSPSCGLPRSSRRSGTSWTAG